MYLFLQRIIITDGHERTPPNKIRDKFNVDALTTLTTKMDTMTQRLERLNVNAVNAYAPSPPCGSCRSFDLVTLGCQVGSHFVQSFAD